MRPSSGGREYFTSTGLFELRSGDAGRTLTFTGYASVTEAPYDRNDQYGQYSETIARGAFAQTLAARPDVAFLLNHDDTQLPLARTKSGTMRLVEDSKGLHVEADLDPANPSVQAVRSAVQRGDLSEMSFAFRVADGGQQWSSDYTQRRITRVDLHRGDVSLVNAGSNPATAGTVNVRSLALAGRPAPAAARPSGIVPAVFDVPAVQPAKPARRLSPLAARFVIGDSR